MEIMRIGSRGSPLALAQSRLVAAMLAKHAGMDADAFPIQAFMTSGDRIQGRLQEAGGKGLFTKELDEALLDGRIDAAVHSMKDLPTRMPDGIVLAIVPSREDPRDGFIATRAKTLMDLPHGATVGTASLRRQAQTLLLRPDLKVQLLRGRVETRLAKIESGAFDATYLALAGLRRLGLENHAASILRQRSAKKIHRRRTDESRHKHVFRLVVQFHRRGHLPGHRYLPGRVGAEGDVPAERRQHRAGRAGWQQSDGDAKIGDTGHPVMVARTIRKRCR